MSLDGLRHGRANHWIEMAFNEVNRFLAAKGEPVVFAILRINKQNQVDLITNRAVIPEGKLDLFGRALTDAIENFNASQGGPATT